MLVGLAACALFACGDDKHDDKPAAASASASAATVSADLGARCAPLAEACGGNDKHSKILEQCTATAQQGQRCAAEGAAVYDCYQRELCGKGDKIWTLDDLRVLAERHGACTTEREALRACAAK
jgi:hypothetical protein